eukprot:362387-Chlamydomonas_euryale.AAC.3
MQRCVMRDTPRVAARLGCLRGWGCARIDAAFTTTLPAPPHSRSVRTVEVEDGAQRALSL